MAPIIRLVSIQKSLDGIPYYSSVNLPKDYLGHFLFYSIVGSTTFQRCISNSVPKLPGLRFGPEYIGKTVELVIMRVDAEQATRTFKTVLRRLKESRS